MRKLKQCTAAGALITGLLTVGVLAQQLDARVGSTGASQALKSARLEAFNIVDHSGKTSVDISITPAIKPIIFELANPARLVLDFPGTTPDLPHDHINVGHGGVIRVRVGVRTANPPITRIVLDLVQLREFDVQLKPRSVLLTLGGTKGAPTALPPATEEVARVNKGSAAPAATTAQKAVETSLGGTDSASAQSSMTAANDSPPDPPGSSLPQSDPPTGPAVQSSNESSPPAGQSASGSVPGPKELEQATAHAADKQVSPPNQVSKTSREDEIRIGAPSEDESSPGASRPNGESPTKPVANGDAGTAVTGTNNPGSSPQVADAATSNSSRSSGGDPSSAGPVAPSASAPASNAFMSADLARHPSDTAAQSSSLASLSPPPLNSAADPPDAQPSGRVDQKVTPPEPTDQPSTGEYIIGEQDELNITVWKEPELSGLVAVRPDGMITVPLVNEVKAVGLTPTQLQALLTEKLKPFVNVPQVTVAVRHISSRNVYLIGEVGREGSFPINSSTTVLQLIAQAGGLKDFAKRKSIYVLRRENGKPVRHAFNYDEVIRGKSSQQNILLQPGDTVIVP